MTEIRRPRLHQIVRATSDEFGVDVHRLVGSARADAVVRARWLAARVANDFGYTLPEIGRVLGNRDHTTILHCLSQLDNLIARDPTIEPTLQMIGLRAHQLTAQWLERCRTVMVQPSDIYGPEVEPEPDVEPEPEPIPEAPREVGVGDIGPGWWSANDAHFRHAMRQAHPEMEGAR